MSNKILNPQRRWYLLAVGAAALAHRRHAAALSDAAGEGEPVIPGEVPAAVRSRTKGRGCLRKFEIKIEEQASRSTRSQSKKSRRQNQRRAGRRGR